MTLKYEAEILYDLMKRDGDDTPSDVLPYESELKEKYLNQVVGAYPKLQDYRPEWLNYNLYKYLPADFPVESVTNVTNASFQNVVPYAYKSAILKGNTLVNVLNYNDSVVSVTNKYIQINSMMREIIGTTITIFNDSDKPMRIQTSLNGVYNRQLTINKNAKTVVELNADEKLDRLRGSQSDGWSIDEIGLNELKTTAMILEGDYTNIDIPYFTGMQSVKMPVLTTSNEDGTKTNILSTSEDVTLRGIGDVQDTLDCLTGEVTERIGEIKTNNIINEITITKKYTDKLIIRLPLTLKTTTYPTNLSCPYLLCDKLKTLSFKHAYADNTEIGVYVHDTNTDYIYMCILNSNLVSNDLGGIKKYLKANPSTIQYKLLESTVKTVDLTILDQNGQNVKQLMSFNGGTHFNTGSLEGSPLPSVSVNVETNLEETLKVCSIEGNTV